MWDYNSLFSDEFIGKTTVDVEDRFYDSNWCKLAEKPIETHELIDDSKSGYKGSVAFWMEVVNKTETKTLKKWDISPRPNYTVQMRMIVWEGEGLPMVDIEECSDFYVYGFVNEKTKQATDVHFRNQDGNVIL